MPMASCEFSFKRGGDDTVRCRALPDAANCCGNVKFCRITGRWENNEQFKDCPIRKKQRNLNGGNKNGKQV